MPTALAWVSCMPTNTMAPTMQAASVSPPARPPFTRRPSGGIFRAPRALLEGSLSGQGVASGIPAMRGVSLARLPSHSSMRQIFRRTTTRDQLPVAIRAFFLVAIAMVKAALKQSAGRSNKRLAPDRRRRRRNERPEAQPRRAPLETWRAAIVRRRWMVVCDGNTRGCRVPRKAGIRGQL